MRAVYLSIASKTHKYAWAFLPAMWFIILLLLLVSCAPVSSPGGLSAPSAQERELVAQSNTFAFMLYREYADSYGNIVLSPYSVYSAFSLIHDGAKNATAAEIKGVFHLQERSSFASVSSSLGNHRMLHMAMALWGQQEYLFLKEYLETADTMYDIKMTRVDFMGETETTRQVINNYISGETKETIPELFPRGSIGSLTKLVLTLVASFEGEWQYKFDHALTRDESFLTTSGNATVKMMHVTGTFRYFEDETVQVLMLPYDGNALSMVVFLPRNHEPSRLEAALDANTLANYLSFLEDRTVDVALPKFQAGRKYFMIPVLETMGIHAAFHDADFSGMTGTRDLVLNEVVHQCYIDASEDGRESAGIGMDLSAPAVFRADHPFLFVIRDQNTGLILFLGRISDPRLPPD